MATTIKSSLSVNLAFFFTVIILQVYRDSFYHYIWELQNRKRNYVKSYWTMDY